MSDKQLKFFDFLLCVGIVVTLIFASMALGDWLNVLELTK